MYTMYDENKLVIMENKYRIFYKDICTILSVYIDTKRNLSKTLNDKERQNLENKIKKLKQDNYRLSEYLSHDDFKMDIYKMIACNKNSLNCSKRLVLKRLGYGIKKIRESQNMTMKDLGIACNVSTQFISKIENCYIINPPKFMFIKRLMNLFECDMEYIFGLIDSPKLPGDIMYPIIQTVTPGTNLFAIFPNYNDITDMLYQIYISLDENKIEETRAFLNKMLEIK